MTLLPLIALIRHHPCPERASPAQRAFHLPPDTLVVTVTLVPLLTVPLSFAVVHGLTRRLAPQAATFVLEAPSTAPGFATAETVNRNMALSNATATKASDGRACRRVMT